MKQKPHICSDAKGETVLDFISVNVILKWRHKKERLLLNAAWIN